MFTCNNKNTRTTRDVVTGVFIVNFDHVSHLRDALATYTFVFCSVSNLENKKRYYFDNFFQFPKFSEFILRVNY